MTGELTAWLRRAPATVPALAALALFVVWSADQAGYPLTHWAPGGLVLIVLLAFTLLIVGVAGALPTPWLRIAVACLAGFTALSFLSILWAGVPGDAWEGANRTLLYLLVFILFACWPQRGASAAVLVCGWALAMVALAAFTTLHLAAAGGPELQRLAPGGRLVYPSGYANSNAAQWLMAFWPALLLARSDRLPWGLRGLLAGGAVLLADVALLSQSRGSLYATPLMLVLVFALLPERTRTFALAVPVAIGVGAAAPAVLDVGDRLGAGGAVTSANVHTAVVAIFASAAVVGAVVALGAAVETRRTYSQATRTRAQRLTATAGACTLAAILIGALIAAGNPITRIRHGWDSFKHGYGSNTGGSRLVSGLGSNRYDFYRVALDEFLAHPVVGIGADNFQQQYLRHGRSAETPRYPHSVELRTLVQTGVIGSAIALAGLAAALAAAAPGLRRGNALARTVAAAALAGFAYWLVHGSFDWFWEFAGLGAPAFALLGIACAVGSSAYEAPFTGATEAPVTGATEAPAVGASRAPSGARTRRVALLAGVLCAAALAYSFAAPWLSELEVQSAARSWTTAPRAAYDRLDSAASLNPLSAEPDLVAGNIALRYGDLARADRYFAGALARSPRDAYATLERGVIASNLGNRAAALAYLQQAAGLNPRDPVTRQALAAVRGGRRLSAAEVNRAILLRAHQFS
jgi:tetratricopeptide (TPR) repeat protein